MLDVLCPCDRPFDIVEAFNMDLPVKGIALDDSRTVARPMRHDPSRQVSRDPMQSVLRGRSVMMETKPRFAIAAALPSRRWRQDAVSIMNAAARRPIRCGNSETERLSRQDLHGVHLTGSIRRFKAYV